MCKEVLDLGCGKESPLRFFSKRPYSVGVDIFLPYLLESKRNGIHNEQILADVRALPFKAKAFNGIMALEVIEHLTKDEGYKLLREMEKLSKKLVIISTPNGFLPQEERDGNPFQKHKSAWTMNEFKSLGYKVRGTGGIRSITIWKIKCSVLRYLIILFSGLIRLVTYFLPHLGSYTLLCIKQLDRSRWTLNHPNYRTYCDATYG